jgi:leucine-rich repeat transmembrane neuronal protein 1/2
MLFNLPTDAATLSFNGSQHVLVWLPEEAQTQSEDISLRFRTSRPLGLLVVSAGATHSTDRLEISLAAGRVRLSIRLGDREKVRK